ncbi:cytochrome P450 [Cylindrobasidium torrendii FP15055 ss-10]|uniref:Cytochrome P450 n=1 Tax=Cylindrobasidium torrendii FP15055 ss-10 TaxID=1314674 RepID=A0A0D7BKT4_9AGAR|nr:cytochrome P450 [Cylindrobasidium torrendii FP15055 ss-10]
MRLCDLYLALLVVAGVLFALWVGSLRRLPKPPGPRGLPLLGNVFDIPSGRTWEGFARMGERYGPLISLSLGPVTMVIANTYNVAHDILDKKSQIYSDRPYLALAELVGWDLTTALLPYGPKLKRTRQMFHAELGTKPVVKGFHAQLNAQARTFLILLRDEPQKLLEHCHYHAGAFILRVVHGYKAEIQHDKFITQAEIAMGEFNEGLEPGRYLVNILPFLRHLPEWVPGTAFFRNARRYRENLNNLMLPPVQLVQEQLKRNEAEESFMSKWLKRCSADDDVELIMYGAGSLLAAGAETTAITLHCFFLMMIQNPDIQERLQEELESACGRSRLPTFEDREQLPYLGAVIKEVHRIHPPAPLGVPHSTTQDDVHNGYFIPKGSLVFPNVWNMSRDSSMYPNPFKFNPERFMGPDPQRDPTDYIFGFGRRLCPGQLIVDASIFITTAMCLHAYTFRPSLDEHRNPIFPALEPQAASATSNIKPYNFVIVPRYTKDEFEEFLNVKSINNV